MGKDMRLLLIGIFLPLMGCASTVDKIAYKLLYPIPKKEAGAVPDGAIDIKENGIHLWRSGYYNDKVIVFCHGNAMDLNAMGRSGILQKFDDISASWILPEYPGYGESQGSPSEKANVEAVLLAKKIAKEAYPDARIYYWGWSLGAAVCIQAHLKDPGSGLILTSAWTSFQDVAVDKLGLAKKLSDDFLSKHGYYSDAAASQINGPVLMHHGSKDKVIPYKFGYKLFESFPLTAPVIFIELTGAGHGDVFMEKKLWDSVQIFINTVDK